MHATGSMLTTRHGASLGRITPALHSCASHGLTPTPLLLRTPRRSFLEPRASQKLKETVKVKTSKTTKTLEKKKKLKVSTPAPVPEPAWNVLDFKQYNQSWPVTWGLGSVVIGMTAWAASFIGVGLFVMPKVFIALGVDLKNGGPDISATFLLATQVIQTLAGVAIIQVMVNQGREAAAKADDSTPTTSKEDGLLRYSWNEPFSKPNGWFFWAVLGIALSPVVVGSTAYLLDLVDYSKLVSGGRGTVDGVLPILQTDLKSYLSLLMVTGVLAPIMEETVFRGFLLPSLSRYMPTWTAVIVSAGFFGVAHLSLRDLPVLVALGTLLGFSYVRSRNLLTPILIHGSWNSLVLSVLYYLSVSGVDVQQAIRELNSGSQ